MADMLIGGTWAPALSGTAEEVTSPFDGTAAGAAVPVTGLKDVETAVLAAEAGAAVWRTTPAHERMRILFRAAELADRRAAETARLISAETGKTITEATGEAGRSGEPLGVVQIESAAARDDADKIAALDGADVLFVGTRDVSHDLGVPGQFTAPLHTAALDKVRAAALAAAVTAHPNQARTAS
jgi:acyl-CoA reductase-like NAD-dependent aldehyde dehydrogenase